MTDTHPSKTLVENSGETFGVRINDLVLVTISGGYLH